MIDIYFSQFWQLGSPRFSVWWVPTSWSIAVISLCLMWWRGKGILWGLSYKGTSTLQDPPLCPNYLPVAIPSNTITWGDRSSTYGSGEQNDSVHCNGLGFS